MATASTHADRFATALTKKFAHESQYSAKYFTVNPGTRYDRIMAGQTAERPDHVHAFVERETGFVFKPAGLRKPASGVRYSTIEAAVARADLFGSYLYAR